jgi:hypothetical protein
MLAHNGLLNHLKQNLRLYDRLLEVLGLAIFAVAVPYTLLVLEFGQQGVGAACQQHHPHKEGDDRLDSHDSRLPLFNRGCVGWR